MYVCVGGLFPNQNPKEDGLTLWTKRDGYIEDTDIVVWYTFCLDHIPRLEDWPMVTMHVEKVGFCLVPCGFFNSTPAIDLPYQSEVQPNVMKTFSHTTPEGDYEPRVEAPCGSCKPPAPAPAPAAAHPYLRSKL